MRYVLALLLVVAAASTADARSRRHVQQPSPGPIVCGLFWNWHPPCSQADIVVGSTLYGAGIGGLVGWAAAGGSAAVWTGVGIGAGTGLVAPVVLAR
jgi:hypothetical protein